jgi:hypothetical protein
MITAILLDASRARALEVPSAELTVSRTPEAAACTDETTLAHELRSRMTTKSAREPGPLLLAVALSTEGDSFVATVRVEGRKRGIRTLKSKGPSCDGLHDALMVSLLLLLDEHPSLPETTPPLQPKTPPPPSPPPIVTADHAPSGPPPTWWASAGGALTNGFPERWGAAAMADLGIRFRSFDFLVGGVYAPKREHPLAGGRRVDVGLIGGRARGCYAVTDRVVRASACAVAALSQLSGRGAGGPEVTENPETRGWWLLGAGADVSIPLSPRIGVGISATALGQVRAVSFYIDPNANDAYTSNRVVGWIGTDIRLRIW